MKSITFVCWKWKPAAGYRSQFGPDTVNVLRSMILRHYHAPHRFCCVTDDTLGIDPEVEIIKPWNDFANVPAPSGLRNPSCYRRLRAFHPDAVAVFGDWLVSMDLDLVIVSDITRLFDRHEDFVIYADTNPRTYFNGSLFMLKAGTRRQVWDDFHPVKSPLDARRAGHFGSDQAWISHKLGPNEAKFTPENGVYSYRNQILPAGNILPANARVVVFHGEYDPWTPACQRVQWIREHYHKRTEVAA